MDLLILSGRLSATAGDIVGAESSFRKVIEMNPGVLSAYGLLAQLYVAETSSIRRSPSATGSRSGSPRNVGPPDDGGDHYGARATWETPRRQYEKVLQVDASGRGSEQSGLHLREDRRNLDVALQLAQTAKEGCPTSDVNDTLGYVYVRKGLGSLAMPPLEASTAKDPKNPVLLLHLGQAYALTGDKVKAKKALEAALAISGTFEGPTRRARRFR